jgi:hypothetical protein
VYLRDRRWVWRRGYYFAAQPERGRPARRVGGIGYAWRTADVFGVCAMAMVGCLIVLVIGLIIMKLFGLFD